MNNVVRYLIVTPSATPVPVAGSAVVFGGAAHEDLNGEPTGYLAADGRFFAASDVVYAGPSISPDAIEAARVPTIADVTRPLLALIGEGSSLSSTALYARGLHVHGGPITSAQKLAYARYRDALDLANAEYREAMAEWELRLSRREISYETVGVVRQVANAIREARTALPWVDYLATWA